MSTTPFLGCKISLISKSEIRYEGILYTIDPKESTIALAKVRSYGTEDRPAERQVPPREEIFEYIIFRANDIKDLIVDDPPASIAPGLADPAIIQAHSTSTSSAATFPSTSFPQMSTAVGGSGQRSTVQPFNNALDSLSGNMTASKASASVDSRSRNSTPTNASHSRQSPLDKPNAWNVDQSKHTPHKENQRRNTAERGGQNFRGGRGASNAPPQGYNHNHSQNRRGSGPNMRGHQSYGHPHMPPGGQRYNGPQNYNRQFNYSGRRPQSRPQQQRGSQNHRISTRPHKEPLKFDEDYDFDKAYEEFKGIEEKMSNLKLGNEGQSTDEKVVDREKNDTKVTDSTTNGEADKEGAEPDQFYNKTKSFFDTISCEALEREKGNVQRIDWKAERKLNSETFGVPLSYRRFGYGRGRGGYSNRGYHGYRSNRGFSSGFNRGGGGGDGRRFAQPAARGRN